MGVPRSVDGRLAGTDATAATNIAALTTGLRRLAPADLTPDHGFSTYPPPWLRETGARTTAMGARSRRPVPMVEFWRLQLDARARLARLPDGQPVEIRVTDG